MAWFREPPAHGAHGGGAAHEVGSNAAATPGSCHGGAMGQGPMAERTCKVRHESELSSPCPHRGPEEQRHLQRRSDLQAEMRQRQPQELQPGSNNLPTRVQKLAPTAAGFWNGSGLRAWGRFPAPKQGRPKANRQSVQKWASLYWGRKMAPRTRTRPEPETGRGPGQLLGRSTGTPKHCEERAQLQPLSKKELQARARRTALSATTCEGV